MGGRKRSDDSDSETEVSEKKVKRDPSPGVDSDKPSNSIVPAKRSESPESRKKHKKKKSKKSKSKHDKEKHHKYHKKCKHTHKRKDKSEKDIDDEEVSVIGPVVPEFVNESTKSMAPITKEEHDKRQSAVRRVYDEETGRHRLIKGDGEVLEEIVSKAQHESINKQSTANSAAYFAENVKKLV